VYSALTVTTQTQRYSAAYISGCETQDHIHHEQEDKAALRQRVPDQEDVMRGFNLLKPNDIYICRTAALTSRRYILNIYSTNIHTEYFKHAA